VKKCHRKPNTLRFEATEPVFRAMGVDLTAIEGIEAYTALVIQGEIGVDVSKFPTEKHFARWLGLCPNHQESNRKRKSRRVRKGKNRVAIALRLAARSLQRSHSALGLIFGVGTADWGSKGRSRRRRTSWRDTSMPCSSMAQHTSARVWNNYEAATQERIERTLRKKARALGYDPVPRQPLSPAVS
jgi:transposase